MFSYSDSSNRRSYWLSFSRATLSYYSAQANLLIKRLRAAHFQNHSDSTTNLVVGKISIGGQATTGARKDADQQERLERLSNQKVFAGISFAKLQKHFVASNSAEIS